MADEMVNGGAEQVVNNSTPNTTSTTTNSVQGDQGGNVQSTGNQQQGQQDTLQTFAEYAGIDINSVPEPLRPILQEKVNQANKKFTQFTQDYSPYKKLAEQTGLTHEQLAEAAKTYQFLNQFNSPQEAIVEMARQAGPEAVFGELVKQVGPLKAAQVFNQTFSGQPAVTEDPLAGDEYYQQIANAVEQRILGKVNPMIQPIQQTIQQQTDAGIKAKVNSQIDSFIKNNPKAGIDQNTVWNAIQAKRLPLQMLEMEPGLVDMAIMSSMGGRDKYDEYIRNQAVSSISTKFTQKVLQNNENTATLSPGSGVSATTGSAPIIDGDKLKQAARDFYAATRSQ